MSELKPSAVQPYMLAYRKPRDRGYAAHDQGYAAGQREARTALRKAMIGLAAYGANLTDRETLDAMLSIVHGWMFSGEYALEVEDDGPDSGAVPSDQSEPGEVREPG